MADYRKHMKEYIDTEIRILQSLNIDELNAAANAVTDCRKRGGTVYTIGNGGSAATASHMAVDLGKGANEKPGPEGNFFRVECLADNVPTITAIANDISYDDIFVFQLERKLKPGDLLIAISGSGNSPNIVKAAEYAGSIGVPVVGITGYDGGKLGRMCDFRMHCPVNDMQISEDIHMMFDHMLMRVFCLCGKE
ncbi:MAG: SIS domain-containing protein [Synergistaceae bacterium]|nr:SIS domain-containing protein [Synergistaceae bacterium]